MTFFWTPDFKSICCAPHLSSHTLTSLIMFSINNQRIKRIAKRTFKGFFDIELANFSLSRNMALWFLKFVLHVILFPRQLPVSKIFTDSSLEFYSWTLDSQYLTFCLPQRPIYLWCGSDADFPAFTHKCFKWTT